MPFESVLCQKCNGTVACYKNLTHLIKLRFCILCAKCAKYLAFDTSAVDALIFGLFLEFLQVNFFFQNIL